MALERWEIDSGHSGIQLSARHMMLARVRGVFSRWSGTILADSDDLGRTTVDIYIDASSLDTGILDRDAHLKSADFLDVAMYPEITFKGTRVDVLGDDRARLAGELTLRGVTRAVLLAVEFRGRTRDPWGHERAGFSAKVTLDRRDYGLEWNQFLEAGGALVGYQVDIDIEIEAVRQDELKDIPAIGQERTLRP